MIMLIIMHCSRTIPVDFVITGLSEQDHFWHPVKVVIWLLSELEHRLKPTLLRWQQRIVIYFWIAFLRNIMPRTPPLGQGKKWSHRKITTSEIYCTKNPTLPCLFFESCCPWMSAWIKFYRSLRKKPKSYKWQLLLFWCVHWKFLTQTTYLRLQCKYSSQLAWHQHSGLYNITLSTNYILLLLENIFSKIITSTGILVSTVCILLCILRHSHWKNAVNVSTFWKFCYHLFLSFSKKFWAVLNSHNEKPPTYNHAWSTTSTGTFFLQPFSAFSEEQKRKPKMSILFAIDNVLWVIPN